jgi:hypothetical protein
LYWKYRIAQIFFFFFSFIVSVGATPNSRATLLQVAKLLQCLANGSEWNRERPFADTINEFLREMAPTMASFINSVLVRDRAPFVLCLCFRNVFVHVPVPVHGHVPEHAKAIPPTPVLRSSNPIVTLTNIVIFLGMNPQLYENVEDIRYVSNMQ